MSFVHRGATLSYNNFYMQPYSLGPLKIFDRENAMAQPSEKSAAPRRVQPKEVAPTENAPNAALHALIEQAGAAYFEACHRMARAITQFKGRRKKR